MPVDVLLLLDVSGSMRPHIERIAEASDRAVQVLGHDDRLGIMVFDRQTRTRMPLRPVQGDVRYAFDELLRQETFNGGTDITRALYDAAEYMRREGRRNARRAIVILTDDQTERGRDERGVGAALARGDIVLSALIAPDSMNSGRIHTGGGRGGGGGMGWPGMGGPLGGIILGPRRGGRYPGGGYPGGGYPGGGYPGGGGGGPVIVPAHTSSAGTANIARQSGGDSFRVEEASAFENTLQRLRQRYTLYFQLPEGVKPGQERDIQVELTTQAQRQYAGADVHYRRLSDSGEVPAVVSSTPDRRSDDASQTGGWRRVDDPPRETRPTVGSETQQQTEDQVVAKRSDKPRRPSVSGGEGGARGAEVTSGTLTPAPPPAAGAPATAEEPKRGGWRRVKPGEQP
jgi:hypothetical protein